MAREAPRPDADDAAVGQADHRLDGLVAGVRAVLPRVEEGEEPGSPERGAGHRQPDPDQGGDHGRHEGHQRRAGGVEHDHHHRRQDDGGAEVRLEHDQAAHQREVQQHGYEGVADVAHPLGATVEQIGDEDDDGDLGELRGLDLQRPRPEPSRRAVHGDADSGDENRDEQRHGDAQPEAGVPSPELHVDVEEGHEGGHPDDGPHRLAFEVRPRRPGLAEGGDRRRRQDHDQADHVEHRHHGGEQPEPTGALTRRWWEAQPASRSGPAPRGGDRVRPSRPCTRVRGDVRGRPTSTRRPTVHGAAHASDHPSAVTARTARWKSSPRSP